MTTPTDCPTRPSLDLSSHEALASASAHPAHPTFQAADMRRPLPLAKPLSLRAGLCLVKSAEAPSSMAPMVLVARDAAWMEQLAASAWVVVVMDDRLVKRLFALWNGLLALDADEVGDWSLVAAVVLRIKDDALLPGLADWFPTRLPTVLALGASVYASGDVAFSVTLEGFDAPLWFDEQLDLAELAEL